MAAVGFLVSLLGLGVRDFRTLFFCIQKRRKHETLPSAIIKTMVDLSQHIFCKTVYPYG